MKHDTVARPTSPKSAPAPSHSLQSPSILQLAASPFHLDNDSIFGHTEEEDGSIFGKGRKRTKFGRPSSEWVFIDSPPSPIKETGNWNTDEFDFEVGDDEDLGVSEQARVHVTSPTPSQRPVDEGGRVDGVNSPDVISPTKDAEPLQDQISPSREHHEELTSPEQVDAQASLAAPEAGTLEEPEAVTVDKFSEIVSTEYILKAQTSELTADATLRRTTPPIQYGSELATPSRELDEHDPQDMLYSRPSTPAISRFGPDSTEILEWSARSPPQHHEEPVNDLRPSPLPHGTSMSTQEIISDEETPFVTDAESATFSNVFESFPEQTAGHTILHVETEEKTEVSDSYEYTPRPDYGYEDEVQGEWAEDLGKESSEVDATYVSEAAVGEDVEEFVEEDMSELGESAESPSDLEVDECRSMSSAVEHNTQQPIVPAPTQPQVIVIDSDSDSDNEPQIRNSRSAHGEAISPPRGEDADMSEEQSDYDEARPGSPRADATDATFDDRMLDVLSRDDRGQGRIQQGNAGAAKHLGLDGCADYEGFSGHKLSFSAMPSGRTLECKIHRLQPHTLVHAGTSSLTEMAPEPRRLNSWSIPVRTLEARSQKARWGRTLHTGTQMMTPAGTQESVNSQAQELSPTSPTAHNLLTPQFSQKSQSVTSTSDTSDIEIPLDDDTKETSDKESTPLAQLDTVSHPTPEQMVGPLATGALIEQTDDYPKAVPSETSSRRENDTTEANKSLPEKDAEAQIQHVSPELSWPVAGLRTRLAYFCPLSLLSENINSAVDTMSIVASATPVLRGTRKPRDYFTTLHLLDPSTAGTTVCPQLFRKQKDALPVASKGDVILLRNFKVRSMDNKSLLCTMGHSSWAVFIQGNEENVQIKGLPVAYDNNERACVTELRQWYVEEGAELIEKNESLHANQGSTETTSVTPGSPQNDEKNMFRKYRRARNSTGRRLTVHHLRHGRRRYTDLPSSESIHKLRDGTLYAHL